MNIVIRFHSTYSDCKLSKFFHLKTCLLFRSFQGNFTFKSVVSSCFFVIRGGEWGKGWLVLNGNLRWLTPLKSSPSMIPFQVRDEVSRFLFGWTYLENFAINKAFWEMNWTIEQNHLKSRFKEVYDGCFCNYLS